MTDKTLKHFFEVYKPKAPDEQKFVDKHVTIKHKDRNGNDDDVFKATNIKTIGRKEERHGYDSGEDEKVYEEVEDLDELSRDTLRRYRMKSKAIGDNEKGDIGYRSKGRDLAARKTHGGQWGIPKAKVMAKEEVESLEEGTMKLSKVHIVHHHDHPAAKEFAKHYTEGMKGEHREGGPSEKDEAASNRFHERYSGMTTRHGFAGSGTTIYHDHKTGAKWKVDRHPNGKTFYGTDHIISHHIPSVNESVEEEILSTEAEDRVIRSLVAYYEELGEEVLIEDIVSLTEELISELSTDTLRKYRDLARFDADDAHYVNDDRRLRKRSAGSYAAGKKILKRGESLRKEEVEELDEAYGAKTPRKGTVAYDIMMRRKKQYYKDPVIEPKDQMVGKAKVVTKEEVEDLEELSTATLQSYRKKARAQGNAIVDKMKVGGGDWSKDQKDTKTLRKRSSGAQMSGKTLRKRGESLKTEEVELEESAMFAKRVHNIAKHYGFTNVATGKEKASIRHSNGESITHSHNGSMWSHSGKSGETIKSGSSKDDSLSRHLEGRGYKLKEEVEQIDELSKATLGSYVKKAKTQMSRSDTVAGRLAGERMKGGKPSAQERKHSDRANKRYFGIDKAVDRLTKEEVINRAVEKYSPSEEERLSLDEQLVARIEDMKESHIHLILNLFEQLDESNQRNLLDMIDQGRVNEVLDFAISAVRGE